MQSIATKRSKAGPCVAVPARIGGTLIGAIGLSGPSSRMSAERLAQMGERLLKVSTRVSEALR